MISELLGEAVGIIGDGERLKHSFNGVLGSSSSSTSSPSISPALSPSPSPSSSTVTTPTSSSTSSALENLRCPRCDSTNTKFCYYNNYNLTQPRYFCKTCRRYWTKGGALRNVPIGGGCRKNKPTAIASSSVIKSTAAGKFRAMAAEMGTSGFMSNFEHEFSSSPSNANPILWGSPDQNSHMLSLLRANQNPNPNSGPMSSSAVVKEEVSMPGSHGHSSQSPVIASGGLNARILGLDASAGHVITSFGISTTSTSSLRRDNERQHIGFILGEAQGTGGAHEFYQRIRSSGTNYCPAAGNQAVVAGSINNVGSCSSSSSLAILDSSPVAAADQLGCWNPILSWSDLPTTHGAYP